MGDCTLHFPSGEKLQIEELGDYGLTVAPIGPSAHYEECAHRCDDGDCTCKVIAASLGL